eukprot:3739223-Rhodomonas_salina.2
MKLAGVPYLLRPDYAPRPHYPQPPDALVRPTLKHRAPPPSVPRASYHVPGNAYSTRSSVRVAAPYRAQYSLVAQYRTSGSTGVGA